MDIKQFGSFEEAQSFAKNNNKEVRLFLKKDGESNWIPSMTMSNPIDLREFYNTHWTYTTFPGYDYEKPISYNLDTTKEFSKLHKNTFEIPDKKCCKCCTLKKFISTYNKKLKEFQKNQFTLAFPDDYASIPKDLPIEEVLKLVQKQKKIEEQHDKMLEKQLTPPFLSDMEYVIKVAQENNDDIVIMEDNCMWSEKRYHMTYQFFNFTLAIGVENN